MAEDVVTGLLALAIKLLSLRGKPAKRVAATWVRVRAEFEQAIHDDEAEATLDQGSSGR